MKKIRKIKQHTKRILSLLLVCGMVLPSITGAMSAVRAEDGEAQSEKTIVENFEDASVDSLDAKYEAYQYESTGENVVKGDKVSTYWGIAKSVPGYGYSYNTAYLRPTHNASANKLTQLTYKDANMKDFEVKIAIANNYTQYGMCIAPAGESYKSANASGNGQKPCKNKGYSWVQVGG